MAASITRSESGLKFRIAISHMKGNRAIQSSKLYLTRERGREHLGSKLQHMESATGNRRSGGKSQGKEAQFMVPACALRGHGSIPHPGVPRLLMSGQQILLGGGKSSLATINPTCHMTSHLNWSGWRGRGRQSTILKCILENLELRSLTPCHSHFMQPPIFLAPTHL